MTTHDCRFHTAILSLSMNLTNPKAPSIPVAAFTVGEVDTELAVALVMPSDVRALAGKIGSKFLAEILATLPDSLHIQISDMLDIHGPKSIDEVLQHVVEMFQNTISVSSVKRDQRRRVEVGPSLAVSDSLQRELVAAAMDAYRNQIAELVEDLVRPAHRNTRPASRSWPLPAVRVHEAVACC